MIAARLEAARAGVRPVTVTAPARRAELAWPRLPAVMELATTGAGYLGCALVRLAIHVAAGENGWAGVKAHLDTVNRARGAPVVAKYLAPAVIGSR